MTHGAFGMLVLKKRGVRVNLFLLAQEKSSGLLLREGFKGRVAAIRAKARLRLLASQGRGHVSIATSLVT